MLDDVVSMLEMQPCSRRVSIHADDDGFTEHEDAAAAIAYLHALRRQRRQRRQVPVRAGNQMGPVVRRRPKSVPPRPLQIDSEFNAMQESVQVGSDVCPKDDLIVVKPQMPQMPLHILGCPSRKHIAAVLTMESLPEEEEDDVLTEMETEVSEESEPESGQSEPESGQSEPESGQMKELSLLADRQDGTITA